MRGIRLARISNREVSAKSLVVVSWIQLLEMTGQLIDQLAQRQLQLVAGNLTGKTWRLGTPNRPALGPRGPARR